MTANTKHPALTSTLALTAALAACAAPPAVPPALEGEPVAGAGGPHIAVARLDDGATIAVGVAANERQWRHFDVDTLAEVDATDSSWDLAFGGEQSGVDVRLADAPDAPCAPAVAAFLGTPGELYDWGALDALDEDDLDALEFHRDQPGGGWAHDLHFDPLEPYALSRVPAPDGPGGPLGAGDYGWYRYTGFVNEGEGLHRISPRPHVAYLLRTGTCALHRLRFVDFYNAEGDAHFPQLELSLVRPAP